MRGENDRYSGYRGRTTTTDKLRMIAMILFALVLLAVAALLIGQRYIVYTDDGIRLELPFLEQEEPQKSVEELENIEVVVEPNQPEENIDPVTPEETAWVKAVTLPLEAVLDGTAAEQARQLGANAIVLDMKTDLGQLGYVSQLPLAQQLGVNYADPEINGRLGELSGGEFQLIARISCFRDRALAEDLTYAIHSNSDRRWLDYEEVRWSSPASTEVRGYLTGIMVELAHLGFDEILLDHWGYPSSQDGQLEYIKAGEAYPVGELDKIIGLFIHSAGSKLADSGTVLSVRADDAVFAGGVESGQTPEVISRKVERIWLEADADPLLVEQWKTESGAEEGRIVKFADALEPEQEGHQWLSAEI